VIVLSDTMEDYIWVTKNYEMLQNSYPGQFIVVKNGKIIAAARSFDQAEKQAKKILTNNEPFIVQRIEAGDLFAYDFRISPKENK